MKMAMFYNVLSLFVAISLLATNCQGSILAAADDDQDSSISCLSWRVANEANNTIGWSTDSPPECKDYIKDYMLGHQYKADSKMVIDQAIAYAENLSLPKDDKNIWVFDIDETVLSNAEYFLNPIVSAPKPAPALPESKRLYKKVLSLGIKVVFLTGRPENRTEATKANLVKEGFGTWEKLILKDVEKFKGKTALEYKSTIRTSLEETGYRIVGNIGDQWSDIAGPNPGKRVFKLPNPMYYIA